ncbi:YcxB family protein [Thiosocius teredinicola]|uniref:YcxB family protein n=1 Tax=Thiosocius teredinicola TaxID=1973002 RepID=UPI0009913828
MEVKFALNRPEFAEFINAATHRVQSRDKHASLKATLANLALWLLIGLGFAAVVQFYQRNHESVDMLPLYLAVGAWLCAFVLYLFWGVEQQKHLMRNMLSDSGCTLIEQQVVLTSDGVTVTSAMGTQSVAWEGVLDYDETASLLCLYVDNSIALLVPKRAFEDESDMAAFKQFVSANCRCDS